ncbi:hypothetical protein M434DRAFT_29711 [Hypoxylon sp. CO27-5]|nr:hypothetical protein M434DRAFT_29711 [Hypoxylon sp. CO27-5]
MEFYIFWGRKKQDPVSVPKGFESHPGGPFYIGDGFESLEELLSYRIRKLVRDLPVATVIRPNETMDDAELIDEDSEHLQHYRLWNVDVDLTLSPLPHELEAMTDLNSGWRGVEVKSPALWATDDGFNQVRQVCEFISSKFWTSTHPVAGLHIHVGNGKKYFPIDSFRHIAAFLYAADPILAQSHPEHRHHNTYCYSLRLYSYIAREELGIVPVPPQQLVKTTSSLSFRIRSFFRNPLRRNTSRSKLKRNIKDRKKHNLPPRPWKGVFPPTPKKDPKDRRSPMLGAVALLLRQTEYDIICELMGGLWRPAYNFGKLGLGKRTIEFRRPASSVDPAEVVAQARIAVGLCGFAADPDEDLFKKIIIDCDTADEQPSWYDVYDLFIELDLLPEAKVVHAALTGTISDSTRTEYWSSRRSNRKKT